MVLNYHQPEHLIWTIVVYMDLLLIRLTTQIGNIILNAIMRYGNYENL